MRNRILTACAVGTLLVSLAACGSDDTSTSTTTTDATATTTTTEAKADPAADTAKAKDIVLQVGDFPAGWTQSPSDGDTREDDTDKELNACIGLPSSEGRPQADSEFSQGDFTSVQSSVEFAPTAADASKELAAIKDPKAVDCLKRAFSKALEEEAGGAEFSELEVQPLSFPTLGDGTVAYRMRTTVTAEGAEIPLFFDLILFIEGRAEMSLVAVNAGEPFDAKLAQSLAEKMAGRA